MKYTTVQKRHSEKWLERVTNVKAYTLNNCFSGEDCGVEALRWAIEKTDDRIQLNADKTQGRMHCHSNKWYEFKLSS